MADWLGGIGDLVIALLFLPLWGLFGGLFLFAMGPLERHWPSFAGMLYWPAVFLGLAASLFAVTVLTGGWGWWESTGY